MCPMYEYQCPVCEKVIEVEHSIKETPIIKCDCRKKNRPVCKRLISGCSFTLKGDCWAKDGYSSERNKYGGKTG